MLGRIRASLSLLDKQEMHRAVCNDDKGPRNHSKADHIMPISKGVEAKCAQDGGSGNLDVKTIFVVNQGEEGDLVNNKSFEAIMED